MSTGPLKVTWLTEPSLDTRTMTPCGLVKTFSKVLRSGVRERSSRMAGAPAPAGGAPALAAGAPALTGGAGAFGGGGGVAGLAAWMRAGAGGATRSGSERVARRERASSSDLCSSSEPTSLWKKALDTLAGSSRRRRQFRQSASSSVLRKVPSANDWLHSVTAGPESGTWGVRWIRPPLLRRTRSSSMPTAITHSIRRPQPHVQQGLCPPSELAHWGSGAPS